MLSFWTLKARLQCESLVICVIALGQSIVKNHTHLKNYNYVTFFILKTMGRIFNLLVRFYKLKIAESSVFIFSKLFD